MPTARILMLVVALAMIAAACGSSDATTTTTTATAVTTTTASVTTTTAAAQTTTSAAAATTTTAGGEETTTTELTATVVAATTAIGSLEPYGPGDGPHMFPPGSVEAHWYQWDGSYVVLYRGFDANAGQEICAGNSILIEGTGFSNGTNSPYLNDANVICIDAAAIFEPPDGVQVCGPLLYYPTAIPVAASGTLYGTLEIGFGNDRWEGQTSTTPSDAAVPQFEPGLAAYELPPSGVDALGVIACGA